MTLITLSQMASRIRAIQRESFQAQEYDEGFDGGEFSGAASFRMLTARVATSLYLGGWTGPQFKEALTAATSERWAHFSGLTDHLPDDPGSGRKEFTVEEWYITNVYQQVRSDD